MKVAATGVIELAEMAVWDWADLVAFGTVATMTSAATYTTAIGSTLGFSSVGLLVYEVDGGFSPPLWSDAIFAFNSAIFLSVSASFAFAASDFYFLSSIFWLLLVFSLLFIV